jgi:hypothetical protein
MLAAITDIASVAILLALIGMGAIVMLIGAVVAVIATPDDRPVEIPARPAGISAICLGLLIFIAAATTLTDVMA